jgi:hypothetical protein
MNTLAKQERGLLLFSTLEIALILKDTLFTTLIAITLSQMFERSKVNPLRILFIGILAVA